MCFCRNAEDWNGLITYGWATLELSLMPNNPQQPNQEHDPRRAQPGRQNPDQDRERGRQETDEQRIDKRPERDQERPQ